MYQPEHQYTKMSLRCIQLDMVRYMCRYLAIDFYWRRRSDSELHHPMYKLDSHYYMDRNRLLCYRSDHRYIYKH